MTTQTYLVAGMTCAHCVTAVTTEILALPGVTEVAVELRVDKPSEVAVSSTGTVSSESIAVALDEAGDYTLVRAT
jgi:copper chaperone